MRAVHTSGARALPGVHDGAHDGADAATGAPLPDGALDWLAAHLHWFDPAVWDRHLPPRAFPAGTVLELMILCRMVRRGRWRDHRLVREARDLATAQAGSTEFLAGLARADASFPYRAYLVALVEEAGGVVPRAREVLETVSDIGCGDHLGRWRPVQHRLEMRYVLDLLGTRTVTHRVAALVHDSIVAGHPDPLSVRDDELYAMTHVLFYATDFGARRLELGHEAVSDLIRLLRVLVGVQVSRGDWDLAGELLWCLVCLGDRGPVVEYGFTAIRDAVDGDGAVPGPRYDPRRHSGLHGETAEAYLFGTCHHTTMVAAMAFAEMERVDGY